ncbi:hypothetical protein T06_9281 [Trichinella sp. T6]|nr:hypothetical protein T06_9281 [Trichinella sp. T6]
MRNYFSAIRNRLQHRFNGMMLRERLTALPLATAAPKTGFSALEHLADDQF